MTPQIIEDTPPDADQRLCITVSGADGNIVSRSYGPNFAELLQAHEEHSCDLFCNYCYEEACAHLTFHRRYIK